MKKNHESRFPIPDSRVWVLLDDKPGHANQALGVAEKLGKPFEVKTLAYTPFAVLPNVIKGASLIGIAEQSRNAIIPPWPDLVIGAGRKVAPVARYIKQRSGCKIVQIMWPGWPAKDFDLIAVPEHDGVKPGGNVMVTQGAPHRLTQPLLEQEAKIWESTVSHLPRPWIALMVGGDTKKGKFAEAHAQELGRMASAMVKKAGGALLVTTSRRTRQETAEALRQAIDIPMYFHIPNTPAVMPAPWLRRSEATASPRREAGIQHAKKKNWIPASAGMTPVNTIANHANPYTAFLGLAEAIIVTGDSISMCSEACFTGKPVYIYAPVGLLPGKHEGFIKSLLARDFVKKMQPIDFEYKKLIRKTDILDAALQIAGKISES